ncbi:MAG TPA: heparan-alpha-glucosaminide N-acetyltransferase domain-containing protein [Gemmatimonadales bacterium]|jgi:uncharacterized membrane protein
MTRRLTSIDAVRGLIMIIMALDHVRDFIHRAAASESPTNLATTTPILFMTRWVTHICAPMFMVTAGMGAFLWWQQGRTRRELSTFLLTRGLWLIVLEVTVMRLAYDFDIAQSYPVFLIVLYVLGLCMVTLAALIWLPLRVLAAVSVATIALHNILDRFSAAQFGSYAWIWNLLHQSGVFTVGGTVVLVAYPLIPWAAVMALGFCLGQVFLLEPAARQRFLARTGIALCVAFIALRALNVYGDPQPWSPQHSATFTVLSFLNTTKYPPSLAFLLMTIGPGLLLLAWFDRHPLTPVNPMVVLGRVPLFFFILHFYAAHAAMVLLALIRYGPAAWSFVWHPSPSMGGPKELYPAGFGYDLWVAYAVWIAIVIGLYPVCRWFAGLKARRKDWWLSYL